MTGVSRLLAGARCSTSEPVVEVRAKRATRPVGLALLLALTGCSAGGPDTEVEVLAEPGQVGLAPVSLGELPALDDPAIRKQLADLWCRAQGMKYTNFRTMSALSQGRTPGPEVSIGKLVAAGRLQEVADLGSDLYGESGLIWTDDMPQRALFQRAYLYSPGWRLGGGTDEILRNTIAERVLGLPPEPRADKGLAFKDIPTGPRS